MKLLYVILAALPLLGNAEEPEKCVSQQQLLATMEKYEVTDPVLSAVVLADGAKWGDFKTYLKDKLKVTISSELEDSDSSEIFIPRKGAFGSIATFKDGCLTGTEKVPLVVILKFIEEQKSKIPA